jgi:predicted phage-related endonuclease
MATAKAKVVNKVVHVQEVKVERYAVELGKKAREALVEFQSTRDAIRDLEKTKEALEEILRKALGQADVALIDGVVRLEVSHRQRNGIDSKKLEANFPEAWKATQKVSKYSVLVTK